MGLVYFLGISSGSIEKRTGEAIISCCSCIFNCFLSHSSGICILTAEVMEEVRTLKCICESWEVIITATRNLPPLQQAVLYVDYFWLKCPVFNIHHHLFVKVLIKLINQLMKAFIHLRECRLLHGLPFFCSISIQAEDSTSIVTRGYFQLISSPVVILGEPINDWFLLENSPWNQPFPFI